MTESYCEHCDEEVEVGQLHEGWCQRCRDNYEPPEDSGEYAAGLQHVGNNDAEYHAVKGYR